MHRAVVTKNMPHPKFIPPILFFPLLYFSNMTAIGAVDPLDSHRWKHRLIIASVTTRDAAKEVESSLRKLRSEILDRDLRVLDVSSSTRIKGAIGFSKKESEALRQRLSIPTNGNHFVLIGKDGGVKARQNGDLSLEKFFALIDTMPMRQQEMRRKRG
jgi:hypothetical protein